MKKLEKKILNSKETIEAYDCYCGYCACDSMCSCPSTAQYQGLVWGNRDFNQIHSSGRQYTSGYSK